MTSSRLCLSGDGVSGRCTRQLLLGAALVGLTACAKEIPRQREAAPSSVASVASIASAEATPTEATAVPTEAACPAMTTATEPELPPCATVPTDPGGVVDCFLRKRGDDNPAGIRKAADRLSKEMCRPPGRRDLENIVAARVGSRETHQRRENALFLLSYCLERKLDGPYVDVVVDYWREERDREACRHHEQSAVFELGELMRLRPSLQPEVELWARQHAPLNVGEIHQCDSKQTTAWSLLRKLRVLRPGMLLDEALAVLGPSSYRHPVRAADVWEVDNTLCHVPLFLEIEVEPRGQTVKSVNVWGR